MTECSHISRVKEWGFDNAHNFRAALWDCVNCGAESSTPFVEEELPSIDHTHCNTEPCFGCKAKGLQLNTGDANSQKAMSNKKWNGELDAYRSARAQGIQPEGTSMGAVQRAVAASETLGKAYDADTMTSASFINKESISTLTEAGAL